jgi:hypothetical protein
VRETEIGMVVEEPLDGSLELKLKTSRRRRARVVLPEEEGPDKPRRRGGIGRGCEAVGIVVLFEVIDDG